MAGSDAKLVTPPSQTASALSVLSSDQPAAAPMAPRPETSVAAAVVTVRP